MIKSHWLKFHKLRFLICLAILGIGNGCATYDMVGANVKGIWETIKDGGDKLIGGTLDQGEAAYQDVRTLYTWIKCLVTEGSLSGCRAPEVSTDGEVSENGAT